MTAKEMLLDYASKLNNGQRLTNEQWLGQAMTEGIVINREPMSKTVCNIKREGKTIIVTETLKEEQMEMVNGKPVVAETVTEIFRVNL